MNIVQQFEKDNMSTLSANKKFPDFKVGDTVKVNLRIVEGANERIQAYEGLCISRVNRSLGSSFTVRKISHGSGVERKFPLYSPLVASVELVKKGVIRRAKLYYMRALRGKAARIEEKHYTANSGE